MDTHNFDSNSMNFKTVQTLSQAEYWKDKVLLFFQVSYMTPESFMPKM